MELNERIGRYLAACPPAVSGQNGHGKTFAVACAIHRGFNLTEEETFYWLSQYNTRCDPPWSEPELRHKAKSAANAVHDKPAGYLLGDDANLSDEAHRSPSEHILKQSQPLQRNPPEVCLKAFLGDFTCSEADLFDASPIRPPENLAEHGWTLLLALYKEGEQINFVTEYRLSEDKEGRQKAVPYGWGNTVERDMLIMRWQIAGMPNSDAGGWMRMNPLDGNGTKDANVTAHRFALLEFDNIPTDQQLSLFAKLPLPIAALLTSGGKSIHAWVKVDCPDASAYKEQVAKLMSCLQRFGLDGKNKNPARLSRLVGVVRKVGCSGDGRQRLLYLNPNPQQKAIL